MTISTQHKFEGKTKRDVARRVRAPGAILMTAKTARKQLGCGQGILSKLVYLDAIEAVRSWNGSKWLWTFYMAPGADRTAIYEAWVARVLRWNHNTADRHKKLREACGVPDDFPKPTGLDDFLCALFAKIGVSTAEEVVPFFVDRNRDRVDRDRIKELMAKGDWRQAGSTGAVPMEPRLAIKRFPQLAGLPDTCLDPKEDAEAPADLLVGRATALEHLAPGATMFCLAAAASGRTDKNLGNYQRGLETIERRMRLLGLDNADGRSVQEAILSMLTEARQGEKGCDALLRACLAYRTVERYLRGYVETVDADGARGLSALLLPGLPDINKVNRSVERTKAVVRERGGQNRKRDANRAAGQLDRHAAAAHNAMEQVTAIMETAADATTRLEHHLAHYDALDEEARRRTPAFVEMLVPTTVLDANGNIVRGASQTLVFWAWRERDSWLSLERGALRRQRGMRPRKRRHEGATIAEAANLDASLSIKLTDVRAHPENYADVVFEFRGCIAGEGGTTCEPRFVTLLRHGVDHAPAQLSARQQRRRHGLMRAWNIKPITVISGGLIRFGLGKTALRSWMLDRGRVVVPVTESYFATLIGTLGFDIVRTTLARVSEAIQPEQDLDRWKTDDATGRETIGFLAAIKTKPGKPPAAPVAMVIPEKLFERIMETGRTIAIANGHADGWLPDVDEPPDRPREADTGSKGKAAPRRARALIFQWRGRAVTAREVGDLVRWVMCNRGRVTPHVIRHAGANELREMGVAERVIQAILRHGTPRMTAWYAHRSAAQARKAHATTARSERVSAANEQARIAGDDAA